MGVTKSTKIKIISISKWYLFQFIFLSLLVFYRISNAISEKIGDASTYQKFYLSFLKTGVWPYGVQGGGEPSFIIIAKFSSLFGKYGLAIILASAIVFISIRLTQKLNLNKITPFIFCLSFLIPFNTITLHLCTSWRTAFSVILSLLFLDSITNKHKNHIISIVLFFLTIFSHSTGVIITISFLTCQIFLIPAFNKIKNYKLKYKYLIYLFLSCFFLIIITYPIIRESSYVWTRIGEYFTYDALNEVKSTSQFFIKGIILVISEIYLLKSSIYGSISKKFHESLIFQYIFILLISLFLPIRLTDRLVLSIYWLTLICLISKLSTILMKSFKFSYRL
tara:strand:+ start:11359 stop:12366 length:1008 start_codon:yes stop_codon:yes gene_type:complete